MPAVIYPYLTRLMLQLLTGSGTVPATLYLGLRTDAPAPGDTSVQEIGIGTAAGYHRVAFARSSIYAANSGSGTGYLFTAIILCSTTNFPAFTGIPAPTGATHWFITDSASGVGNLYASGPLNPSPRAGTLAAPSSGKTIVLSTGANFKQANAYQNLQLYDYLSVGSACAGTLEIAQIAAIGSTAGSTTAVTLAAPLRYAHPSGDPFVRDGATRYYTTGFVEAAAASVVFAGLAAAGNT